MAEMGPFAGSSEVRAEPTGIRNLLHIRARTLTGRTLPKLPRGPLEDKVPYAASLSRVLSLSAADSFTFARAFVVPLPRGAPLHQQRLRQNVSGLLERVCVSAGSVSQLFSMWCPCEQPLLSLLYGTLLLSLYSGGANAQKCQLRLKAPNTPSNQASPSSGATSTTPSATSTQAGTSTGNPSASPTLPAFQYGSTPIRAVNL